VSIRTGATLARSNKRSVGTNERQYTGLVAQPVDEQLAVLSQVVNALRSLDIAHMVSGSLAASYYVEPRMTRDLDLVVDLTPATAGGLAAALASDFYCDEHALRRAAHERSIANAIHSETLLKVDFIVRKDDAFHREEFGRRRLRLLGTVEVDLVSTEDLILSKLLWFQQGGSAIQRADIERLLRDAPELDRAYLTHWAQTLRVDRLLAEMAP